MGTSWSKYAHVSSWSFVRTGSLLGGICCDDWCCGPWCHGDMNQDTSIHRADSDAHCINPTSQMIILLKIVSRAVWPNMETGIQVMAWCLCGARPMPEPTHPVLSVSSIYDKTRWLVLCFCVCVCVCTFCEFSFFFSFFDFLDLEFNPLLCAIVYVRLFLCATTMMIS